MKHLDLFSGIGGFSLAAREVWGEDHEIVGFCDNDKFCQNVLAKNFPGVPVYEDIKTLTVSRLIADAKMLGRERQQGRSGVRTTTADEPGEDAATGLCHSVTSIDLLTGGFPCQPFSHAGKRKGTEDSRHLWPEMRRVIREVRPRWVIGENVRGLLSQQGGVVFEAVCADLESLGYEVWPYVLPACGVGAPHRRERVWIVGILGANTIGSRRSGRTENEHNKGRANEVTRSNSDASDTESKQDRWLQQPGVQPHSFDRRDWNIDWREQAQTLCAVRQLDDGLPKRMARLPDGSTLSEAAIRRESLKAYGNAIVPQVAVEIMRAIKDADDTLAKSRIDNTFAEGR
jgi:DNA (cytosine-5)-methyltransferase 1